MTASQLKFLLECDWHRGLKSRTRESPTSPDSCDVSLLHWPSLYLGLCLPAFI